MDKKLDDISFNHIPENYLTDLNLRLDALEKKRKRRRLLWIWVPGLVIAGICLGLYESHEVPAQGSKKTAHDRPATNQSHYASIAHKPKSSNTPDPEYQKSKNPQANIPDLVKQPKHEKQSKHTQGISHLKTDIPPYSEMVSELPNQRMVNELPAVVSENIAPEVASQAAKARVPLLSIGRINQLPWPNLGALKTPKTEAKRQHMLGFSSGVSGIVSSFTPIDVTPSTFVNTSFPDYKSYAQTRKAAERATSSLDLSIFYRQQAGHWIYQIGIAYNEWGEQIVYPFNSLDGTNRYRYLNIPIGVGYQWTKNKVSLSPMLGLSAGVKLNGKGYYLMPDGGVDIVEAQRFTTSAIAQIELAYDLNPFIFHVTPGIRSSIGSPVKSTVTKNIYQAIGCQIGFIYRFEGKLK
ncbi:MAG: hypothetical protein EBS09_11680 [Flavobacteriia bacterium]|nr:hypothetical protein [Flavobacteriia bacterium]